MQRLRIARTIALTATLPFILLAGPASAQNPPAKAPEAKTPPAKTPGDAAKKGDAAKDGATGDAAKDGTPGDGTPADGAPPANAEPTAEDLERARDAFMAGNQLFKDEDFDKAVEKFKEAYRLSKNPLLLYNIGFTHDKRKDVDLALFYYDKFMKDAGPTAQVYDEVKDRVEKIKKAKEANAVFDSGSMGKIEDGAKPKITEFMHKAIEEAPPGYPLDITVFIPEGSGWQVTLFFRAAGEERFDSTLMAKRYNELVGRIPKSKTLGKTVQYYIEVRDKTGAIVARSGRSASPNLVFIEADAKPRFYPDVDSEGLNDKPPPPPPGGKKGPRGPRPDVDLGFMKMDGDTFRLTKWSVTGAAVVTLGLWVTFNRLAAQRSVTMEDQAQRSNTEDCPTGSPCRSFSNFQKDAESTGKLFEGLSYPAMALGIAATGVAGYLWYKEFTQKGSGAEKQKVTVVPIVGQDYVGSAAMLSF